MATTVLGKHTIKDKLILSLDDTPKDGVGIVAPLGTIALASDRFEYFKYGSGNLDWGANCKTIYTQSTSVTVANTIVETSILTSTFTLPANFFTPKSQLLIKHRGFHSAVASPTIRIRVKLNSVVVLDTGVVNSGNSTNGYFDIDGVIACRSTGVTGGFFSQGFYQEINSGMASGQNPMVNTVENTIDTTIAQTYDVTLQWGTANVGNTSTTTNGYVNAMKG